MALPDCTETPKPFILRLTGELDLSSHDELSSLMEPAVLSGARVVIVQSAGVTFVDCAGLAPLMRAAAQLRARGAHLLMPHPSPAVVRLATLTGACEELGLVVLPVPLARLPWPTAAPALVGEQR